MNFSRKQQRSLLPLSINVAQVERVENFKYLEMHFFQNLTWSHHISVLVKKAHLRQLRDFTLPLRILRDFYTCTVESILSVGIITWMGNNTQWDQLALASVVCSATTTVYFKRTKYDTTSA